MKVESPTHASWARVAVVLAIVSISLAGCAVAMLNGAAKSRQSVSSGSSAGAAKRTSGATTTGTSTSGTGSSGAATSGTATSSAATSGSAATDNAVSSAVRARFASHAALKALKVGVSTNNGVVTLRGQVHNVEQLRAAQLEARAVKGVRAVKNELTVR